MKKRCRRLVTIPMPPRGLRPKLDRSQLQDLALVHIANLDAIARGQADGGTLWEAVASALTWSRAAQLMDIGQAEMAAQLHMLEAVLHRYQRTGRVCFAGPEYQLAKDGVEVMDELARLVDLPTAIAAAEWSEKRIDAIRAGQQQGVAA